MIIITNYSLNSFKSAAGFMTLDLCFIVNVFNVIIISVFFVFVLLYVCN